MCSNRQLGAWKPPGIGSSTLRGRPFSFVVGVSQVPPTTINMRAGERRERRGRIVNTIPGMDAAHIKLGFHSLTPGLCTLTRAHTITHTRANAHTYAYPRIHTHIRAKTRAHTCVCAYIRVCVGTRTHTPAHAACNFFQWKENPQPKKL